MKARETAVPTRTVHLEKNYAHSPERVWRALTDPNALADWLLPGTFRPRIGHRFRFTRRTADRRLQKIRCQVVELDAPYRLAYTWQAENDVLPTLVTWTLEPTEEGTRLRLEHTGLPTTGMNRAAMTAILHRMGRSLQAHDTTKISSRRAERCPLPDANHGPHIAAVGRVVLETPVPVLRVVARRRSSFHSVCTTSQETKLCTR